MFLSTLKSVNREQIVIWEKWCTNLSDGFFKNSFIIYYYYYPATIIFLHWSILTICFFINDKYTIPYKFWQSQKLQNSFKCWRGKWTMASTYKKLYKKRKSLQDIKWLSNLWFVSFEKYWITEVLKILNQTSDFWVLLRLKNDWNITEYSMYNSILQMCWLHCTLLDTYQCNQMNIRHI